MQQEDIKIRLKNKILPDIYARFKDDLQEALNMKEPLGSILGKIRSAFGSRPSGKDSLLSKKNAELGLLLINEIPDYRDKNARWTHMDKVPYKGKRYSRIEELLGKSAWDDESNYNLLIYFLGPEKAGHARYAWKQIRFQMYQTGYSRRSFRSPEDRELYFRNQIDFIVQLLPQTFARQYDSNYHQVYTFYDLTLTDQIKYNHATGDSNPEIFRLWSAAIDEGNQAVFTQLEEIIYNKAEDGKITQTIIKALLNSNKEEAWALIEKLLLAAQRQEGLRQTILESLDETSIGGLKYIIKVIIDHQLARFSSVVRAIDVWAGLGWESERETTVRSFLEKALYYLEKKEEIPHGVKSDNNADVYMALWAQGVYDVELTLPYLQELYRTGDTQKRTLALIFAEQTVHYKIRMPLYEPALEDHDLQPLACAINFIFHSVNHSGNDKYYNKYYPGLFDKLNGVCQRITVKEKTFESFVFSWMKIHFEKKTILKTMVCLVADSQGRLDTTLGYFDDMDAEVKTQLSRKILPIHAAYNYKPNEQQPENLTGFQRKYAMLILKDRSEHPTAFKALYHTAFEADEWSIFPDLLKRKAAGFRNNIITLLERQKDEAIITVMEQLLVQGDLEQRLAGLDILLQLKKNNRLAKRSATWITAFRERKNISPNEDILLAQLIGKDTTDVSAANGFGLYDPRKQSRIVLPAIDPGNLYEKLLAKNKYAFSMPVDDIKKRLTDLAGLLHLHKDYEYEVENWDKSREKIILGNVFRRKSHPSIQLASDREEFENYPLYDVWEQWYLESDLTSADLALICLNTTWALNRQVPPYEEFMPDKYSKVASHANVIIRICTALKLIAPFEQGDEFYIGAASRLFASFDDTLLKYKDTHTRLFSSGHGWQQIGELTVFLSSIRLETLEDKKVADCWNLYNWRQFSGLPENIPINTPPLMIFCRAYRLGIISEDEMMRGLLTRESIYLLSARVRHQKAFDFAGAFAFVKNMFERIREHILDTELKRGDLSTPLTFLASALQTIYGLFRFTQIIAGLGKTNLYKGYVYTSSNGNGSRNKQESFSTLLKNCYPLETDSQESFNQSMQKIKVTESRLIEAAIYAPQWQKFVSSYLGWKGLDSAIWWMHAHTKTVGYQARNAEAESEIARYSSVDLEEFKNGAVDKEWFLKAYKEIGKDRWAILYDAAKYISDGNGHRRARIYADVLLGNLTIKDVSEKVQTKRDQDYVRIFGLVPLNKANKTKDVLARYEYLQQFKKESRQFGAQKQSSEASAILVAMDNLARNAGYADPIRLTWAMETRQVQDILSKETQVQYDDILIGLIIDEEGQADVVAFKGDQQLKAIPAKYKKDKKIEELNGFKKTLRDQFRRSKKGLEDAMVRGDVFQFDEIQNLFAHPVISKHLEKLVFIVDNGTGNDELPTHGFYKDGKLTAPAGKDIVPSGMTDDDEIPLTAKAHIRIAHCTDLYKTGSWAAYQRLAFDKKLAQPFKQIFRELYLITEDERKERSISRRYAGNQIQPKQTVALLKSRGWKVDYTEGLQKVFHQQGFAAKMYAMADWFSPAEMESPTLETVIFQDLKTSAKVAFESINPRIFSEVMRDIDLVVSVAHAGGVDPEASHSSIEMRTVLLKETMRLFKLNNVEITGSHAKIKGKLGEYSVHLGSAVSHKMAAGYLSILPVHSQQRGRLFLPFVDDDPKSAEVISKVLLLARDQEIQDPTILRQLS